MKNVTLKKTTYGGVDSWELLVGDQGMVEPSLSYFAKHLIDERYPSSTINAYCAHVASFIDYVLEATKIKAEDRDESRELTGIFLVDIISLYPRLLAGGAFTKNKLLTQVAISLGAKSMLPTSASVHLAAVNKYLLLNESLHARLMQMADVMPDFPRISEVQLFPAVFKKHELSSRQSIEINSKSVIAGVVCGGAKFKRMAALTALSHRSNQDEEVIPFPAESIYELITNGFKSYRDKALFALAACSGARMHELLSIRFPKGIDVTKRLVYLINPRNALPEDYFGWFSIEEIHALPYKGRQTTETLLIEPFEKLFWDNLLLYMKSSEFIPSRHHPFLFQVIKGKNRGAPLLKGGASQHKNTMRNIRESFYKACKRIGVEGYAPHSLRHFYGDWCRNFYPYEGGFGLEPTMIQDLMGHTNLQSTIRYARKETTELRLQQKTYYSMLENQGDVTFDQLHLKKLEAAINNTKKRMEMAKNHNNELSFEDQ